MLTVHARYREQKGHNTGLANWEYIKKIKYGIYIYIYIYIYFFFFFFFFFLKIFFFFFFFFIFF